jgi:hypothetical protein
VDAHDQGLDEVGRDSWNILAPGKTRRDVASLQLGFLGVILLGVGRLPKCTLFLAGLPSVRFADFLLRL